MSLAARPALAAALMLAGCMPAPAPASARQDAPPAAPARTYSLTDESVQRLVHDITAARQLTATRAVSITRLRPRQFAERLLQKRDQTDPGSKLTAESAFLVGFDFIPAPGKRAGIATMDQVLEEQVVGFYDVREDRVFVPDQQLKSEKDLLEQRAVLAHEVQHALQAQHFPPPRSNTNSDEALAQLSLIEGDAMVAMGALLGAEAGAPVGRTLRRILEVTKSVPLATVTRGEEKRNLDRALELTRRRLEFPYHEGMLLVSDVYRAGGFPLVDKMYQAYPRSTEQVLHPEKYLAGELPRPVADPMPPAGYSKAAVDTLGELDIRTLLGRCLDREAAERAAEGWAGDRFGVFVGPERRLAVSWISAWDTEQDAMEAESALQKSAGCWTKNALGLPASDYAIDADFHVRRQGKLVAFLRGLPAALQAETTRALFPLVGPEPKAQPLTDLKIPPRVKLPEPSAGNLQGDIYRNDWLGLVGRVPPGMSGEIGSDFEFMVQRPDVLVRGGLAVSTRIVSDEQTEKTFKEVQDVFVAAVHKHQLEVHALGGQAVQTPLGAGVERAWRIAGTSVEMRLILLPICAGTGSVVFMQTYGDPYARQVLDGWLGSFRWINGRNLKACDFLDPK